MSETGAPNNEFNLNPTNGAGTSGNTGGAHNNQAFGFDDNFVMSETSTAKNDAKNENNLNDADFKFDFDEFQYQDRQHRMSESSL